MRYTPNYNMVIGEGTDAVNPLTQIFPNFETIDTAMENNKNGGITTASEVTTGGVHAIVRVNTSTPVFRFTATSAWTTGDTMTLDGSAVTVHLTDGTTPKSGAYIIGAEVVGIVNGSLVTLLAGSSFDGVLSFNSRQGVVIPQSGDYTANMIGYNNTTSGLAATDVQSAVDELAAGSGDHGIYEIWKNSDIGADFAAQTVSADLSGYDAVILAAEPDKNESYGAIWYEFDTESFGAWRNLTWYAMSGTTGAIIRYGRRCKISATGVEFEAGTSLSQPSSWGGTPSSSTANDIMIPVRILGLKHND